MKSLFKLITAASVTVLAACSWDLNGVDSPDQIVDPSTVETMAGAIAVYGTAVNYFSRTFAGGNTALGSGSFVYASAAAGDELGTTADARTALRLMGQGGIPRHPSEVGEERPWFDLHATRLHIDQAIGHLRKFQSELGPDYLVEMFAMRGYISIFIGELYCSGVPFSKAVYNGDIDFGKGLSTDEVFERAVADFDSALAISTDNERLRNLVISGKARALLNLNKPAEAASLVANIPTSFKYDIAYGSVFPNFTVNTGMRMVSGLGVNGLDYLIAGSAGDPRTASVNVTFMMVPMPAKYSDVATHVSIADGIEARLIEAEALLRNSDISGWAAKLNQLRANGGLTPMDTLTSDSTTNAAAFLREDVMFRERAFWLFVTGRRFGDMRRKVRQYNRPFTQVFTIGTNDYLTTTQKVFSGYANLAPPEKEAAHNPKYSGCFNRNA